jgi:hypothetical protein
LDAFGIASFQTIWYWILHVVVWALVTHRTLGVPYDMILRARRLPDVAERVELMAVIFSGRATALYKSFGVTAALLAGFLLSGLFALGFLNGLELAQAAFLLLFPLAVIGYSTLSAALRIERRQFRGTTLVQVLSRRHFWHQVVAVAALLGALTVAMARHPGLLGP